MQDMQILMLIESLTGQSRFKSVNSVNNIQNSSVRWSAPPKYIFIYNHPPPHAQLPRQEWHAACVQKEVDPMRLGKAHTQPISRLIILYWLLVYCSSFSLLEALCVSTLDFFIFVWLAITFNAVIKCCIDISHLLLI